MPDNIKDSIQEYLKKINSSISVYSCASILFSTLCLVALLFLSANKSVSAQEVFYSKKEVRVFEKQLTEQESRPFASKKGKTYTFSWCQGSSRISAKNKMYFTSVLEAQNTGRTLSKLCKK